jgi:hypothetical protein
MELLDIPNEILSEIIELLEYDWHLTAFGVANRRLHGLVNTYLYHEKLPGCSKDVLEWIVKKENEDAFAQCLKANILAYVDRPITSIVLREAIFFGRDRILERLIVNGITFIDYEEDNSRQTASYRY